jgi:Fe2+ transport system protein B
LYSKEEILENLAGDLYFNPRRALIYCVLGALSIAGWFFLRNNPSLSFGPYVLGFGGIAATIKGLLMFRKHTAGFGITETSIQNPDVHKKVFKPTTVSLPHYVAQFVQDFGAGSLLLWPILKIYSNGIDPMLHAPVFQVFITGVVLFVLGWGVRRFTQEPSLPESQNSNPFIQR